MGPIIITTPENAKEDGSPKDVDRCVTAQHSEAWQTTHSMGCDSAVQLSLALPHRINRSCSPPCFSHNSLEKCGVCPGCWHWRVCGS